LLCKIAVRSKGIPRVAAVDSEHASKRISAYRV
jgi:hypothetical protein